MDELRDQRQLARGGRHAAETGGAEEQRHGPDSLAPAGNEVLSSVPSGAFTAARRFRQRGFHPDEIVRAVGLQIRKPPEELEIGRLFLG